MTTGTNLDVSPGARRWAAQLLGVRDEASSGEVRRAYFRKLRECDFLPPSSLHQALRILDGTGALAVPDEEWLLEEECRLRAEVASYAEEFFTLPVTRRRERWKALRSRCQHVVPLVVRLQALKAGLDVENQSLPLDSSLRGQLAEHLLQSFPLLPLARATSRQAFLGQIEASSAANSHKHWEEAARYLLAEWPALAALDEVLVQHIANLRKHLEHHSQMQRRSQANLQTAAAGGQKRSPWWLMLLVPAILTGIRLAATSNNSSSPRVPVPSYSAPQYGKELKELEHLRPVITDSKAGKRAIWVDQLLIQELFDPSKYDVAIIKSGAGDRTFVFTPRPGSTTRSNGPQANNGSPLVYGEASLRLMGVSPEQINRLGSRSGEDKPLDITIYRPPEATGQKPRK